MAERTRISALANGFRVITETLPSVRTAAVGVWVDVGARYEAEEVNGVAHFLEHMAFKGTTTRSARDIAEAIENVGGSLNAYTSREHTSFHARLLAEDTPLAIEIVADILKNASFVEDELLKERHVILQEIGEVQDTPDDLVFDLFQESAYPGQPMGRSILGSTANVERLSAAEIRGYMAEHYAPGRMILAAAGAVDHVAILAQAERWFADLPPSPVVPAAPACYRGGVVLEERDLEQVHVCLGVEGLPWGDPDYFAAQVLSTALGGGMSSRLFQEVREARGLCYGVASFAWAFADSGIFGIEAGTGAEDVLELVEVAVAETRALVQAPSEAEIARARAQLKAGTLMGLESCFGTVDDIARQLLCYGRRIPIPEIIARIDAVDRQAIMRVGHRLFGAGSPTTLTAIGPLEALPQVELGKLVS